MEAAGPVIDIVVESMMARIKKELGYWWNSKKNVTEMGSRMKQLYHTAQDMKRKKEANDVNHLVVPHHVPTWLEDVESINNEVASIPTDGIGIGCFNIKVSYKAGKKSFDILERISGLEESESKIKWTDEQIPLARVPSRNVASTSLVVDDGTQNRFESRDLIFKEALKSLKPNKTHMMALCGMGGVGKSHMMERLKKAVEDSRMFYWVVKVVVGENTDVVALQHAIAEKTGGALTTTTRDARAELLNKRFVETSQGGQKKILVILDDVWKVLDLKDLGLPNPLPNGFKLLMTSRDENVCTQIGVDTYSIFRISALNDKEAKILFFETVGLTKDDDPDLYKIGENIVQWCFNLPISLITIASTLKGSIRDESDWKEALSRLQHHDLKDHYRNVHEIFKISYDRLQKDDEKAIFLLSGLFPDDFDIPVEELMRYGWGFKLFPRTISRARLRVESCVKSLIRANLLAESDRVGCVRMHDLARAFALSNSVEVKQASIVKHSDILEKLTEDANECYERILLKFTSVSEFPKDFNCPNLTFLKLTGGVEQLKFPAEFYKSMEKLQVLSYEELLYPPLLPSSGHCSSHLRTLCLHGCELISDWSAIGYLVNLEILSFANSRIEKLPSVVRKLKKLKLLDLTGCLDLHIDDGVFRDLNKLEELYMRVSGQKAIRFTNANCDELEELSMKLSALEVEFFDNKAQPKNMSFKNLERFKISVGCLLQDNKDIYSFQNTLKLVTNSNDLLECKINELFKKTEVLHLTVKDMKHLRDVITMHPPQDSFCKLRVLDIWECVSLRYLFTSAIANGLRKLVQLKVERCPVLESLIHFDESENDRVIIFQELKFLSLYVLPQLGNLCNIDTIVKLPQLVELNLGLLPKYTSIYPDNEMQPFFNKQVSIPKLEKLKISHMENLKQIWPSESTFGEDLQISMVRVVDVTWCNSLVNLFPINPMPYLRNLEKLLVYSCKSIEVLFNIDLGRVGKIEEVSSNLRSIHVTNAENLTQVWRIKGANKSQISGFQAVEDIHIHECISFREVFTPVTINFDMRALLDIEMQDSLFNKALKSLHPNNKATKIALCGMGSVGKTRMMEDLVKAVEGMEMFDLVLKLNIGREANPIALQQATAEYIGEDLAETAKEAWAGHLHNRFVEMSQDGKTNILVILDDLWKVLDLKDIGIPSPLPNSFMLLITSRDVNVCAQMGVEKSSILRVGVIDDTKAKSLFFETVGVSKDEDPDLYKIGKEIIIRCGNFPISLETIAYVLKGNIKDKSKWEETIYRLQNLDREDIVDVLKIAFETSYNNLKTDDEKAILFLCSFFPMDSDILVEDLMRYAWGLKLFPKVCTTLAQARHWIRALVDVLTRSKFLTKNKWDVEFVKMQPQAHDFVSSNFTQVQQTSFDHGNMSDFAYESYERIHLNCTDTSEFPVALNYPNLKLLKLTGEDNIVKFPQEFYDRMAKLEVVAYDRMIDPLLPSCSPNLRTLCLNSCSLTDEFSFLENLVNLETLSFADCSIVKLPSAIGKLSKLKRLDVIRCVDMSIEDGVFMNLVNLEELYMRGNDSTYIRFTDANYKELEILLGQLCALEVEFHENKLHQKDGSFKKLEKFNISMGCNNALAALYDENTLMLVSTRSEVVESKMNELFEKTAKLYLQVEDMKNLEDVSMHYSFSHLTDLLVCDCTDLTFLFTTEVASGLTKLEKLEVSGCPVLETLIHGGGSVITFPKLKFMNLKDLPQLMSLCETNTRVEVQQLRELSLDGLPKITSIYPNNAVQSFFNLRVQVPNLEVLRIYSMEKLIQIWPCENTVIIEKLSIFGSEKKEVSNDISLLRRIDVVDCDSLANLFPCNPLPLLNHLEVLHVIRCCSIKVLFNIDLRSAGNINEHVSSLRKINVDGLENLREIWRIKGENNSSALPIRCFQAVEEISVTDCIRYRDVFAPKNINFDIRAEVITGTLG